MNRPESAREALIVEALGDVAALLERVEQIVPMMDAAKAALTEASGDLDGRLRRFDAEMSAITGRARLLAVEHIAQRTAKLARDSIEEQSRAMTAAARHAFSAQLDPIMAKLATLLQRPGPRSGRWEYWLTHAATAVASAVLTFWMSSLFFMH